MHVTFVRLLTVLYLLGGILGQPPPPSPKAGSLRVYQYQPVANHTYPASENLQVKLAVVNATLAFQLGFNLSYWIMFSNESFTKRVAGPIYTGTVTNSIPVNVTGTTFWWNTTTLPIDSGSYRLHYAYQYVMCAGDCEGTSIPIYEFTDEDNGTSTTSATVPFTVGENGTDLGEEQGSLPNQSGFDIDINMAVYNCTVLGMVGPTFPSGAYRRSVGWSFLFGVLVVGISLL